MIFFRFSYSLTYTLDLRPKEQTFFFVVNI